MISIDALLPKIMPYAPGCPEPLALSCAIQAAQDFCQRTRLWRDEDQFNVTPTSFNIVCAPDGAELFEIENALFNGLPLEPKSLAALDHDLPDWRDRDDQQAKWITQTAPGSVIVVPKSTGTLRLFTILKPANDADQLPDFIINDYSRVIADGALAEILITPNQSFTAPDRAQFYSARFEGRLESLTSKSIKGQQRAKIRTRGQFF